MGGPDQPSIGALPRPSIRSSTGFVPRARSRASSTRCPWAACASASAPIPIGPDASGTEVRGLFLLAKAAATDLETAARAGGSCLIAATAMGGRFATSESAATATSSPVPAESPVWSRRWPANGRRFVAASSTFRPIHPAETIASQLADEIFVSDGYPEVGYDGDRRIRLRSHRSARSCTSSPLSSSEPATLWSSPAALAASPRWSPPSWRGTWRATLLMVGTTPLPSTASRLDTAGLFAEAEIKAALHARLRHEGHPAGPAQIESSYQSLTRAREVRENLEILRKAGSTVAYAQADVRDPAALSRVLGQWRARFGEPAGLIHGAGLIKDKLIRQKTIESFDRVLETKLYGALNLIRLDAPGRAQVHRPLLLDRRPVRQRRPVRLRSRQRDLEQARSLARSPLGRACPLRDLGPLVRRRHGLSAREPPGPPRPRHDLTLRKDPRSWSMSSAMDKKGDVEVILSGKLGTLEEPIAHEDCGRASGDRLMTRARPAEIAIIGLDCRFAGAPDSSAFFENILAGKDSHPAKSRRSLEPGNILRPRFARQSIAFRLAAAAISTRPSPSTPPRTASCRARSLAVSPSNSSSSKPPPPPWPTPVLTSLASRDHRVEVVIGRGNYFNRGNLTRLEHGRMIAQTVALLHAFTPSGLSKQRPEQSPMISARACRRSKPRPSPASLPTRPPAGSHTASTFRRKLRRRRRQRFVLGRARPGDACASVASGRSGDRRRRLPRGRR